MKQTDIIACIHVLIKYEEKNLTYLCGKFPCNFYKSLKYYMLSFNHFVSVKYYNTCI